MRIQHNIMVMGAYRNYTNNLSAMKKNLEKLSSGYKINRAGDDAAGLAISEKMRAQITGLNTAQKNAKDGISLVQTAEGALTEVHDMLNRMVTLATQSANGTYDNKTDRAQLQKELEQLRTEIDRIADSSNFNGIKLLDGSMEGGKAIVSGGDLIDGAAIIRQDTAPEAALDKTVLKQNATSEGKTVVAADFTKVDIKAKEGATLEFNIGDAKLALKVVADGEEDYETVGDDGAFKVKASDIADADSLSNTIANIFNSGKDADGNAINTISDQEFTAAAADGKVTFTQANVPTDESEVVDAGVAVSVTYTPGPDTVEPSFSYELGFAKDSSGNDLTAPATGVYANWSDFKSVTSTGADTLTTTDAAVTATMKSDISADAIIKYFNEHQDKLPGTGMDGNEYEVMVAQNTTSGKFELKVNNQVIATSLEAINTTDYAATASSNTYTFATSDGVTLGKITITGQDTSAAASENDGTAILAAGKKIGVKLQTPNSGTMKTMDFSFGDKNVLTEAAKAAAQEQGLSEDTEIVMKKDGDKLNLMVGDKVIASGDYASKTKVDLKSEDGTVLMRADLLAVESANQMTAPEYKTGVVIKSADNNAASVSGKPVGTVVTNWENGTVDTDGTSTVTFANLGIAAANNSKITENWDTDAIAKVINDAKVSGGTAGTALKVTIGYNNTSTDANYKKLELKVNGVVIGVSEDTYEAGTIPPTANADSDTNVSLNFKSADGTSDLGSIDIIVGATETLDIATKFGTALDTELQFNPAASAASATDPTINFSGLADATDASKVDAKIAETLSKLATDAGVTEDGEIVIKSYDDSGTAKLGVFVGDKKIADADIATGQLNITYKDADGLTQTVKSLTTTNLTDPSALTSEIKTGLTFTAAKTAEDPDNPAPAEKPKPQYFHNIASTDNVQGAVGSNGQMASTAFDLTEDVVADGNTLTIGDMTFTFAVGKDSKYAGGENVIDLTNYEAGAEGLIDAAGYLLSHKGDDNFSIGYNKEAQDITIHERDTASDAIKEKLTTVQDFQSLIKVNGATETTYGEKLTLQIGDTAEEFNQLKVDIKDCHADAIGIGEISIADPKSAAEAVQKIKDAINYVSDVRGTLGATQNRLDHTINNLSVMTENIQDAESTIRDTDVAEEMMAYTKNNILIQSAQAMLAQANQVPQGVLQLLQ